MAGGGGLPGLGVRWCFAVVEFVTFKWGCTVVLGGIDVVELEGFLWFLDFFELGDTSLQRSWGLEVSRVPGTPLPIPPPAHPLPKSFSMYLLMLPKLPSQLAILGSGDCCNWTSSPRTPSGGTRSDARHPRASAHAQGRATVWRGRDR